MTKYGKFIGVGVGPGDPSMLTLKAVDVLKKVDYIFEAVGKNSKESISSKIVSAIEGITAIKIPLVFSMSRSHSQRKEAWVKNALLVCDKLKDGKDVAFVTIGDPLIYSTYTYLMKEVLNIIADIKVETIPGITSFQYSASRKNMPIVEDEETLMLLPAWKEEIVNLDLVKKADTVVCLKTYRTRNAIIDILQNSGKNNLLYAQRVGLEDEKISNSLDEIKKTSVEYLSHLIGRKK